MTKSAPMRSEGQLLADFRAMVARYRLHTVRAGGVDVDGRWRSVRVPTSAVLDGGPLSHCSLVFAQDLHDRLYAPAAEFSGAHTGLPDVRLLPDFATARRVPWEEGVASVVCDYADWEGTPVELAPRSVLRRVTDLAHRLGYEPQVAVEFEFVVLDETPESLRAKQFSGCRYLTVADRSYHPSNGFRRFGAWLETIREYGLPLEGGNTERGAGQFEVNLRHGPVLEAADNALMYKQAVRELAADEGLTVTFMARVATDQPGSSGHIHQSLWDSSGGRNLFWDGRRPAGVSDLMRRYVAGSLASLRELSVLFLPFVNSYRRMMGYAGSPTTVSWGLENRTCALRAVAHTPGGCRLEHRVAGADANPYLTLAAALAGGLHGIEAQLEAPEPFPGDAWAAPTLPRLPTTLAEALPLFEGSALARASFGEPFVRHYAASRRWEIEQFHGAVTDWERARYLELV